MDQDWQAEVARALLEIGAVVFTPQEPVTFKSGLRAPVYVDNRRLPFWPAQWRVVLAGFADLLAAENIDCDVIAGMAVGGVPHSAALAYKLEKPSVFVRKEAKGHGLRGQVEGGEVSGRRVLLVEDLVTTGGSSLRGVAALRDAGAMVDYCLAIVSYGLPQAQETFVAAGVTLLPLTSFATILAEAVATGRLDEAAQAIVLDWQRDPSGWAARHGWEA